MTRGIYVFNSFQAFATKETSTIVLGFLAALASSPVIGFVISSIAVRLLHLFWGYKFHINLPKNDIDFKRYIFSLNSLLSSFSKDQDVKGFLSSIKYDFYKNIKKRSNKDSVRTIYVFFNLLLRLKAPNSLTDYTVRRWTLFWTHVNCLTAIILGFLSVSLFPIFNSKVYTYKFEYLPFEFPFFLYIAVAVWHLLEARKSAVDIEYKWLIEEGEKQIRTKTNPSN
jgi:hypothetical protein